MDLEAAVHTLEGLWRLPRAVNTALTTEAARWLGYGITYHWDESQAHPSITLYCQSRSLPPLLRAILPDEKQLDLNGVRVRIVEAHRFVSLSGLAPAADGLAQPGDSIRSQRLGKPPQQGTLGALVRKRGGADRAPWLLSANHCLALNKAADVTITTDAGSFDNQGDIRCIPIGPGPCVADAAVVRLSGIPSGRVRLVHPSGLTNRVPQAAGAPGAPALLLQKWGASTGLTQAPVLTVASKVIVDVLPIRGNVEFTNQIVVEGSFSSRGDSGSLVVDAGSGRPVGIVIAGDAHGAGVGQHLSVISPIEPILESAHLGGPFEVMLPGDVWP